ncbi:FkbM family methyltransferase [Amylibacter sp.]|nr:FkbM family methyltransferase [Amylibacter sp.]
MSKVLKKAIKKIIQSVGYDLIPYNYRTHPVLRQKALMSAYNIETVIDVGANIGNYGLKLLENMNFKGKIHSFEPMLKEYEVLANRTQSHMNWSAHNFAMGDIIGNSEINISKNSVSSSLLNILPQHTNSAPTSEYGSTQKISVTTLDNFLIEQNLINSNILLKIDVQGFERNVILGGQKTLPSIDTIHIEMSLVELYEGGIIFDELYMELRKLGYQMVGVEPGFSDKNSGQLLQIDGLFHRYG